MELAKIRSLSDDELVHQERTSAEQLFRLRFQVSMGQNDGVKKLRQMRKEIAQIKTVARERELGIHGEIKDVKQVAPVEEAKAPKVEKGRSSGESQAPEDKESRARRGDKDSESEGSPQMTETKNSAEAPATPAARRNEKVGQVVSTKMQKTIVVAVEMRKAHAKYKRIIRTTKKFYAHDEQSSARHGRYGAHP